MNHSTVVSICSFCLLVLLVGCDWEKAVNAPMDLEPLEPTLADKAKDRALLPLKSKSVTEAEAKVFAKQWQKVIDTRNFGRAEELVAWRDMLLRSLLSLKLDRATTQEFLNATLEEVPDVCRELITDYRRGDYQLLRTFSDGENAFATFRFVRDDEGFTYHRFRVRKIRNELIADQFFLAATGGEIWDESKGLFANELQAGLRLTHSEETRTLIRDAAAEQAMGEWVSQGRGRDAIAAYDRMPERLKSRRLPMFYRVQAMVVAKRRTLSKSINKYFESFPKDPAMGFVAIDIAAERDDAELLKKGYEVLNEWTGGDPFLDLLVGANLVKMGRSESGMKMVDSVDVAALGFDKPHSYMLGLAKDAGDFEEMLKQLRILRDNYKYVFHDLRSVEGFEDFVASPQFQQWIAD